MVIKTEEIFLDATKKTKTDFPIGDFQDYIKIGSKRICAAVIDVTPEIAGELLKNNTANRPISANTAKGYARQMKTGWALTGETLIVSRTGNLLNGQHRCQACIDSNQSFSCVVLFGVEDSVFAMIDHGKRRSHGDIFSGYKVKNYATMAAASMWLWRYINTGGHYPNNAQAPNSEELFKFYIEHEDLQKSLWVGTAFTKLKLAPPSAMVAMHYLCSKKDAVQADIFFQKTATGIGAITEMDPAIMLRNKLLDNALSPQKYLSPIYISAFTALAWNAYRQNEEVMFIWRTKQDRKVPFPTLL